MLLPLPLFALTLISVSPDGAKDAPMLAELNLFSVEVRLVFTYVTYLYFPILHNKTFS